MKELIIVIDLLNGKYNDEYFVTHFWWRNSFYLAHNVTKLLHNTHPCKNMLECMINKNLTVVNIQAANRHFHRYQIWYDIKESILEKNLLAVIFVRKSLQVVVIWNNIFKFIRNKMEEVILNAYLMDAQKITSIKVV